MDTLKVLWDRLKEDPLLLVAGVIVLAFGVAMVVGSHEIESRLGWVLFPEVLRELGIAMAISVFIAAFIEIGLARKTFAKGLDAVMNQTVPEDVWKEIRQHVISQPVLRHNWTIDMVIVPKNGEYVSTTTVSYKIQCLHDLLHHMVHHEVDGHRVIDWNNCFRTIEIADVAQTLAEIVKRNQADFEIYFPEETKDEKQFKGVRLIFEERMKENDIINWWMNAPTKKLTVVVHAPPELDVKLEPHHPEPNILAPASSKDSWECKGVMLPGQGFEIRLSPVEHPPGNK